MVHCPEEPAGLKDTNPDATIRLEEFKKMKDYFDRFNDPGCRKHDCPHCHCWRRCPTCGRSTCERPHISY